MRKVILVFLSGLSFMCQAQFDMSISGEDTLCIGDESVYSVNINTYANEYLFRDTVSSGNLSFGYNGNIIANTFSFDLWVKPTRTIGMAGESNTCSGGVSVPLANSNQNWAVYASNAGTGNMGVGLTIGTNGLMVGEHSENILVSRLSYTVAISDWVHVAIVYRPDSIFLYLNGNIVRTRPTPCTSNAKFVPGTIATARYSPEFKGNIDEFRLWDIALTQAQTHYIMDKKLLSNVDGLRYYASFDNGRFDRTSGDIGSAEMVVTGLSEINHLKQSSWDLEKYTGETIDALIPFDDNSYQYLWSTGSTVNTTTYSASDTINKLFATVYNTSFSKTDSLEIIGKDCCLEIFYDTIIIYDTVYSIIPIEDISHENLVSYYPFNGDATDFGISNNDGIINGSTLTTDKDGNENSAYYFDGVNDYISIPDSLAITNDFTISFWAFSENADGYSNIICDGSALSGGNDFLINFRGNSIGIRADKSGTSINHENSSPASLSDLGIVNKWVHVAWTMNPSYSKVYLNGDEIAQINVAGTNLGYHDQYSYIGARNVWGNTDNYFKGKLDEFKIYDTMSFS